MSHSKIAQFNWECIGRVTGCVVTNNCAVLSDVVVTFLCSIVVLTRNEQFLDCASLAFRERYYRLQDDRSTGNCLEGGCRSRIEVLSTHIPGGNEESHGKLRTVYPGFRPRFELGISPITSLELYCYPTWFGVVNRVVMDIKTSSVWWAGLVTRIRETNSFRMLVG
jgi:hypothetical protein